MFSHIPPPLQRHCFALECLFRTEKPLTDSKLKAVRDRVRASYSRCRLIAAGSDDLQNAGASLQLLLYLALICSSPSPTSTL